ncbi:hypothetical protein BU26DRAFT_543618 [Trematosphaeria pertusa]|uniref:LCCL domain-containing protein n=1 Tax=Trematosphaeria pertusa TaxID=390896 RepID=A0A6A6HYM9_9PLEO|nr:uncharacterized protein BU26DRAFT_543618 [Trematosphaeria pertusa]KAF2242888.1 hypothetical protein BU26DRAFT_543618 [Trematosphaeria pertusa]
MSPIQPNSERDEGHDDAVAGAELEFEDTVSQLPLKARRAGILGLLQGPRPPRIQSINPLLPSVQEAPPALLNRLLPRKGHQFVLLCVCLLLWAAVFVSFLSSQLPVKDGTGRDVVNLDCVDSLWRRKNECGIDGLDCRPFSNVSFAFRCPARCASVQVLNPRAVGPLDVNYRPLVIGAGAYRGDSFVCGAAIHSGIVSNAKGGCGRASLNGEHEDYPGVKRHGIESIPFDSYFPLSFSLSSDDSIRCPTDPRQALLFISLFFASMLSLFASSPKILFPIFTLIFAHVSFASDPPSASYRNSTVLPDHLSMFAKRLLPAFFCAVVIYWTTVKRTLSGLTAQVEKTVLWLGGFFFGAMSNYTFDWIPISRLTGHDLEQQPGAKIALSIILIILIAVIAGQVYYFWLEGRLLQYLALYGLFIVGILISLAIPGVNLRIHHYILALLLLPGTSLQTRPSLLYQGILLGLFVNGIARWDFDSILQTTEALRGDGQFESVVPKILEPAISFTAGNVIATFSWVSPPADVAGISVLVNDVERDRAFFGDGIDGDVKSFEWTRPIGMQLNEYLRFAWVTNGRAVLDYTKAGTLFANGTWTMEQEY